MMTLRFILGVCEKLDFFQIKIKILLEIVRSDSSCLKTSTVDYLPLIVALIVVNTHQTEKEQPMSSISASQKPAAISIAQIRNLHITSIRP
jgi:hypothetical protein